jgi:hypothetical protein
VIAARQAFLELVRGELTAAFSAITRTGLAASAHYVVRADDPGARPVARCC